MILEVIIVVVTENVGPEFMLTLLRVVQLIRVVRAVDSVIDTLSPGLVLVCAALIFLALVASPCLSDCV